MNVNFRSSVLSCLITVSLTFAVNQPGKGAAQGGQQPVYDSATVQTVTGSILSFNTDQQPGDSLQVVYFWLKTGSETLSVKTVPQRVLSDSGFTLQKGAQVTVTGSRVTHQNRPMIIAKSITKGNRTLCLYGDTTSNRNAGGQAGRPVFDPKTVQTVSGRVINVNLTTSPRDSLEVVYFWLKTATDSVSVATAPQKVLADSGIAVTPGMQVTVTGSRVSSQNRPLIIAQSMKVGNRTIALRDKNGMPLWIQLQSKKK